jgi:hypothetical protein
MMLEVCRCIAVCIVPELTAITAVCLLTQLLLLCCMYTACCHTTDRCVCGFSTVDDIALLNIEGSG